MRVLWAFTWLRWRMLVNSLKSAQRRDAIERVSRVAALIIPGLFVATAVSSLVAAVGLGAFGGWYSVAHPLHATSVLTAVRVLLLLVTVFAVLMPLFVGVHGGAGRVSRFLLLPVSRSTLHAVELTSTLADPWMIFVLPGLVAYGLGLIAGTVGQPDWLHPFYMAGAVAVIAAIGMALVLASLASMTTLLVGWMVRDRRRGEIFILVFIVGLSAASLAPAFLSRSLENRLDTGGLHAARSAWVMSELPSWMRVLPSELYGTAVSTGMLSGFPWRSLGALFGEGVVLYALSNAVHRRVVESVESGRTKRAQMRTIGGAFRIPGMWPGTSAVAVTQLRTAIRSVRGRLAILLPGPIVAMLSITFSRVHADGTWVSVLGSHGYVAFGAGIVFALYASQAFTMNQFGSDRSGLTREFIAPIRDVDLIRGKAAGCGAIVGVAAFLSLICSLTVAPGGSPLMWMATLLGGVAAFLVLSPISALMSVLLPVASDLSKTGTAGNPHSIAMLAGTVLVAIAVLPSAAILVFLPDTAALFVMALWVVAAAAISIPMLGLVAKTLRLRRENLALVAQGR